MARDLSDLKDPGLFGLVALIWGLNYLFVRAGLSFAPPLWLAVLRSGTGALAVVAYLAYTGHWRLLDRRDARDALLIGVPNTGVFFGLWFLAAASIPAGQTAVLVYTFPLWVTLLAGPVLGLVPSRLQMLAVVGGFAGVVLVSQPWLSGAGALAPLPVAELLLGAIAWGIGTVAFKRRFPTSKVLAANGLQLVGGTAALLVAAPLVEGLYAPPANGALLGDVLWLGLLGTALAYSIWFWLLDRHPAANLSAYTFLVPLVALAASIVLLGERLDLPQAVGVGLVVLAIYGNARSTTAGALAGRRPSK
jgi:drug/metabolite transporter (DMT)-like permease